MLIDKCSKSKQTKRSNFLGIRDTFNENTRNPMMFSMWIMLFSLEIFTAYNTDGYPSERKNEQLLQNA